jgi:glutamate-1-semialdehyde 2,1-aminomutase
VNDYEDALATDPEVYARFFRGMLSHGIYLPPSRFEALFISTAHTRDHVERLLGASEAVFATP